MTSRLNHAVLISLLALVGFACESGQRPEATTERVAAEAPETLVSEAPPEKPEPVPAPTGQLDPRVVYRVPLDGSEPQRGPDDALMTIVEFGDFQCPYCARAAPTMDEIRQAYPDDVRIVWLNFPQEGHVLARPAATAALEAQAQKGDEAFWQMHDKLFAGHALSRDDLLRHGKDLGLDVEKLRAALESDKYRDVIDRQVALAKRLRVPGTPSWFMNGRFMSGFPFQTWAAAIDRRIGEARRAVASGVPKSELYDRIVADGLISP